MSEPKIIILETKSELSNRAAEEIIHISGEAICTHAQFSCCLTGGSTPGETYSLMATRFNFSVDWKEVHFFWGDERCVPPESPDSNFGLAQRTLFSRLSLKPSQIHRIKGEEPPDQGARACENELKSFFGLDQGELPRFDLVLLGMGDNAHIASLFPGIAALDEKERLAVAVEVDAPQRRRITLTAPVLNNAARIMFLVSGANKAQAVRDVLEGPRDPKRLPAQMIDPADAEVTWLLDRAAAGLLSSS